MRVYRQDRQLNLSYSVVRAEENAPGFYRTGAMVQGGVMGIHRRTVFDSMKQMVAAAEGRYDEEPDLRENYSGPPRGPFSLIFPGHYEHHETHVD